MAATVQLILVLPSLDLSFFLSFVHRPAPPSPPLPDLFYIAEFKPIQATRQGG